MLSISNLHVKYGTASALQGVNLEVNEGETVALLGRNGMGKTTLVRSISGLTPPQITSGTISFRGQDTAGMKHYEISRAGIGLVPQGRHVFESLSVEENLSVVARRNQKNGSADTWTTTRVYDFFPRLKERSRQLAGSLSGGEQQMLAIGRALMTNPRLLVMDEPSEGLAQTVLDIIRDRLEELCQSGLSVLVAEQNVDLALGLATRVLILGESGTIEWQGSPHQLETDPSILRTHLGL